MGTAPLNWERVLANQAEAHRQALASRTVEEASRSRPPKTGEGRKEESYSLLAPLWHQRHVFPRLSVLQRLAARRSRSEEPPVSPPSVEV
jgi:hypothetical protein